MRAPTAASIASIATRNSSARNAANARSARALSFANSADSSGGTDVPKGKWDVDGTTAYEFSGDGNGALLLPNVTYEFSYDIKKDQISIDYENESVRDGTYTFTVEDNTLTLIGGEGTVGGTYTLTRVEEE